MPDTSPSQFKPNALLQLIQRMHESNPDEWAQEIATLVANQAAPSRQKALQKIEVEQSINFVRNLIRLSQSDHQLHQNFANVVKEGFALSENHLPQNLDELQHLHRQLLTFREMLEKNLKNAQEISDFCKLIALCVENQLFANAKDKLNILIDIYPDEFLCECLQDPDFSLTKTDITPIKSTLSEIISEHEELISDIKVVIDSATILLMVILLAEKSLAQTNVADIDFTKKLEESNPFFTEMPIHRLIKSTLNVELLHDINSPNKSIEQPIATHISNLNYWLEQQDESQLQAQSHHVAENLEKYETIYATLTREINKKFNIPKGYSWEDKLYQLPLNTRYQQHAVLETDEQMQTPLIGLAGTNTTSLITHYPLEHNEPTLTQVINYGNSVAIAECHLNMIHSLTNADPHLIASQSQLVHTSAELLSHFVRTLTRVMEGEETNSLFANNASKILKHARNIAQTKNMAYEHGSILSSQASAFVNSCTKYNEDSNEYEFENNAFTTKSLKTILIHDEKQTLLIPKSSFKEPVSFSAAKIYKKPTGNEIETITAGPTLVFLWRREKNAIEIIHAPIKYKREENNGRYTSLSLQDIEAYSKLSHTKAKNVNDDDILFMLTESVWRHIPGIKSTAAKNSFDRGSLEQHDKEGDTEKPGYQFSTISEICYEVDSPSILKWLTHHNVATVDPEDLLNEIQESIIQTNEENFNNFFDSYIELKKILTAFKERHLNNLPNKKIQDFMSFIEANKHQTLKKHLTRYLLDKGLLKEQFEKLSIDDLDDILNAPIHYGHDFGCLIRQAIHLPVEPKALFDETNHYLENCKPAPKPSFFTCRSIIKTELKKISPKKSQGHNALLHKIGRPFSKEERESQLLETYSKKLDALLKNYNVIEFENALISYNRELVQSDNQKARKFLSAVLENFLKAKGYYHSPLTGVYSIAALESLQSLGLAPEDINLQHRVNYYAQVAKTNYDDFISDYVLARVNRIQESTQEQQSEIEWFNQFFVMKPDLIEDEDIKYRDRAQYHLLRSWHLMTISELELSQELIDFVNAAYSDMKFAHDDYRQQSLDSLNNPLTQDKIKRKVIRNLLLQLAKVEAHNSFHPLFIQQGTTYHYGTLTYSIFVLSDHMSSMADVKLALDRLKKCAQNGIRSAGLYIAEFYTDPTRGGLLFSQAKRLELLREIFTNVNEWQVHDTPVETIELMILRQTFSLIQSIITLPDSHDLNAIISGQLKAKLIQYAYEIHENPHTQFPYQYSHKTPRVTALSQVAEFALKELKHVSAALELAHAAYYQDDIYALYLLIPIAKYLKSQATNSENGKLLSTYATHLTIYCLEKIEFEKQQHVRLHPDLPYPAVLEFVLALVSAQSLAGQTQDHKKANEHLQLAVRQNYPPALYRLAKMLLKQKQEYILHNGQALTKQDTKAQAHYYMQQAAQQGYMPALQYCHQHKLIATEKKKEITKTLLPLYTLPLSQRKPMKNFTTAFLDEYTALTASTPEDKLEKAVTSEENNTKQFIHEYMEFVSGTNFSHKNNRGTYSIYAELALKKYESNEPFDFESGVTQNMS